MSYTKKEPQIKQVTFEWDFAVDGGAIGNYPTGVSIPAGAAVLFSIEKVYTTIDDGGMFVANHHLGYIGNLTFLDSVGVGFWNAGAAGVTPGIYGASQALAPSSVKESTGAELIYSISDLALTAGRFRAVVYYQEFP